MNIKKKTALVVISILIPTLGYSNNIPSKEFDHRDANSLEISKDNHGITYALDGRILSYAKCLDIIKNECTRRSNSNKYSFCTIGLEKHMTSEDILKIVKDLIGCGIEKVELRIGTDSDSRVCLKIDEDPMPIYYEGEKRKIPDNFSLNDIRPGNKYVDANGIERPLLVIDLYEYKDRPTEFSLENYHVKGVLSPRKSYVKLLKGLSEAGSHLWIIIVNRTDKLDEKRDFLANLCKELGLQYKVLDSPDRTPYSLTDADGRGDAIPVK